MLAPFLFSELYIFSEQLEQAVERLDYLLEINPKGAYVNFLKAKVNFKQDDFVNALLYSEVSMQAGLATTEALFIAGVSAYKIDKIETDPENYIYEYFEAIKNKVDLKRENLKRENKNSQRSKKS